MRAFILLIWVARVHEIVFDKDYAQTAQARAQVEKSIQGVRDSVGT